MIILQRLPSPSTAVRRLMIALLVAVVSGCSSLPSRVEQLQHDRSLTEAQRYFIEVALGSEFDDVSPKVRTGAFSTEAWIDGGKQAVDLAELYRISDRQRLEHQRVVRRWEKPVSIYVDGNRDAQMLAEIDRVLAELQSLAPRLEIHRVERLRDANFWIYLGPYRDFADRYSPKSRMRLKHNKGYFLINWQHHSGISRARMYVDTHRVRDADERKHLLREELTQAFGLTADSKRYPDSIFYQHWTATTEYSPLDRELIKMLYGPGLQSGMGEAELRKVWTAPR